MADHLRLPPPRAIPSRRAGGGGGDVDKKVPGRHGRKLKEDLAAAAAAATPVRIKDGVNPAQVFKIRTAGGVDDAKLESSEFQWLGNTPDWTYFVLSREGPAEFERMLDAYTAAGEERDGAPDLTFFEHIVEILPYGLEDRRGPGVGQQDLDEAGRRLVVDAIVWPSADFDEARGRINEVREVIDFHDGEVLAQDDRPRYTVVRARIGADGVRDLLQLAVIERLRTPPMPYLEPTTWRRMDEQDLPDYERVEGVPIGVIDDEVMEHSMLADSIASRESLPAGHGWGEPSDHGTMVAGRIVFGDIESALAGGAAWVALGPLHSIRVLEQNPGDPTDAIFPTATPHHSLIEDAVRRLHARGVRVINLSIADRVSFSGPHLSLWSERMDELARELDVLIVVAAGNQLARDLPDGQSILDAYPDYLLEDGCRVAEPGAGANMLTVGSVARFAAPQRADGRQLPGDRAVAQEGEPSPFTRAGPGAAGGIKPDVLHHGGNWAFNDVDLVETNDFGLSAISTKGGGEQPYFGVANGTSYAAPLVTRVAAKILNRYPTSRANLLRALIGVSARPLLLPDSLDGRKRRRLAGYGSLSEYNALESGGNRVALMYQGEIAVDTVVAHSIPIPREFMEASGDRRVIVSLAFDPEVRRTRRDYLTATMKFHLVRGMKMDEIESVWQIQPQEKDDRLPLPKDRRRPDLVPGSGECLGATLQVRSFSRRNTDVLDDEGFHVVVEHRTATWYEAEEDDLQRYALVVVLEDQEREGVDLRALVEAELPVRPEVEVEPRLRVRG
ncbi:MAG TPA: S8 family peptidase [Solirubrobacterales bacterium]|nr:S8 family peptidase [Solirubrobacterales bacterium]